MRVARSHPASRPSAWARLREPWGAGPDGAAVLELHAAMAALAGLTVTLIWAATAHGFFWPVWVWFALLVGVGLHAGVRYAVSVTAPGRWRWWAIDVAVCVVCAVSLVLIWLLTGAGGFWPSVPIICLAVLLLAHLCLVALWSRLSPRAREQQLVERVDVLTRTRRGALDVQAAELRRIERDLHDGAQARLVALSLQLGRAEARLDDRPEVAALVRSARGEASAAIAELRDLSRGISPPVLADRGLAAAAEALGRRAAITVTVDAQLDRRPPPVLETAAYFVVAESLTNVAKHAPEATAHVAIACGTEALAVEIRDDGPGGAEPRGGGLTGLRHRVEALDGTLVVRSAAGDGTTIRAEFPCAS
jgi:signal transduction histidine kinase